MNTLLGHMHTFGRPVLSREVSSHGWLRLRLVQAKAAFEQLGKIGGLLGAIESWVNRVLHQALPWRVLGLSDHGLVGL